MEGERDLWKSLGEYDENEDDDAWLQDYENESVTTAITESLIQQELDQYDKQFHSKLTYDEAELFPAFQKDETIEESSDDDDEEEVVTNTSTTTTTTTTSSKINEEIDEDEYQDEDYDDYPEDEDDYDDDESEDEDEDMAFIKKIKDARSKQQDIQKKITDARRDKLKKIELAKAKERYLLLKAEQERLAKEEEEANNKKKKKRTKKRDIRLPEGFQPDSIDEEVEKPKPKVEKKIVTPVAPVTPILPPTTPFRVPIIYKKSTEDDESNKKDILIIPSIKFVSFLVYVYKTFALANPPQESMLYLDANGRQPIERMDQLFPNQTLYLIEKPHKPAPQVEVQVEKKTVQVVPKNKQEIDDNDDDEPELRSPIVCVLGHVDTGKTSLLDKIRSSHVQEGEAGGITQQRSRGSSLCDIAILVVDIMHGLEAQTVESISLLKKRRIPFVIALNKIDRIYKWKVVPNAPLKETLAQQEPEVIEEFERRMEQIIAEIAMQGLNSTPYYKNKDFKKMISICPTSAITGEGMQDLELLLVLLMQNSFRKRLHKLPHNRLRCSVLEVKVVEGLGATIDVLLVNGELNTGDKIVVAGLNGPIVSTIRTIITPHPLQELRVKGDTHDRTERVTAVTGVRIFAKELDKVVAGSALWVVNYLGEKSESEVELKKRVMEDVHLVMSNWARASSGVYVQASSLGSLEALLEFLKTSDVPIAGVNIGPVTKRDVIRASSAKYSNSGYACILAFDVRVKKSARIEAASTGVSIFAADIIYHLFDAFRNHIKKFRGIVKEIYPCIVTILPEYIIKTHNPICIGAYIQGTLQLETVLCIPDRKFMEVGRVTAIRLLENPDPITTATDTMVIIKLEPVDSDFNLNVSGNKMMVLGREFDVIEQLYAKITRWEQIPGHMRNSKEEFVINYKRIFGFKKD